MTSLWRVTNVDIEKKQSIMLPEFLKTIPSSPRKIIFEIPYVQVIFQSKSMEKRYKPIGDGVFRPPKKEWAIRRVMAFIKNLAKGRILIRSPWLNP